MCTSVVECAACGIVQLEAEAVFSLSPRCGIALCVAPAVGGVVHEVAVGDVNDVSLSLADVGNAECFANLSHVEGGSGLLFAVCSFGELLVDDGNRLDNLGLVERLDVLGELHVDGVVHDLLAGFESPLHGVGLTHLVSVVHVADLELAVGDSLEELHADLGVGAPSSGHALAIEPTVVGGIVGNHSAVGVDDAEHVSGDSVDAEECLGLGEVHLTLLCGVALGCHAFDVDGKVECLNLGLLFLINELKDGLDVLNVGCGQIGIAGIVCILLNHCGHFVEELHDVVAGREDVELGEGEEHVSVRIGTVVGGGNGEADELAGFFECDDLRQEVDGRSFGGQSFSDGGCRCEVLAVVAGADVNLRRTVVVVLAALLEVDDKLLGCLGQVGLEVVILAWICFGMPCGVEEGGVVAVQKSFVGTFSRILGVADVL